MAQRQDGTGDGKSQAPPCNIEAERAVLGSVFIDPDAFHRVGDVLKSGDFFRERHGWIWETFERLAQQRVPVGDFVLVVDDLDARGLLMEIGGPAYLTDLVGSTPTSLNVDYYANVVKTLSMRRHMIAAAGNIAKMAWEEADGWTVDELHDKAAKLMDATLPEVGRTAVLSVMDAMKLAIDAADANARGEGTHAAIRTGFVMLDKLLNGGYYPGDFVILAARPAMGKSSLMMAEAVNAAKMGVPTLVFSLEMTPEQLSFRMLSMETGIESQRIRRGQLDDVEWALVLEAANYLSSLPLHIVHESQLSIPAFRAICKRQKMRHGLGAVFIDYIQLMSAGEGGYRKDENRQQEVSYISRQLKATALELHVPIIALAQLNRGVESRMDKRPVMSDLRESGSLEQDPDTILFIYRDDYYNEDSERQNIADVIVAKHRNGDTGTVSLYFRKELTQFRDLEIERIDFGDDDLYVSNSVRMTV